MTTPTYSTDCVCVCACVNVRLCLLCLCVVSPEQEIVKCTDESVNDAAFLPLLNSSTAEAEVWFRNPGRQRLFAPPWEGRPATAAGASRSAGFFSASEVDPLELKLQASTVFYGCTTITFHTVGAKADVAFGGHWEISTVAK